MAETELTLKEQNEAERKYQFRRSDTIPGTDIKVSDARAKHLDQVRAEDERMAKRGKDYQDKLQKDVDPPIRTTIVGGGIVTNIRVDTVPEAGPIIAPPGRPATPIPIPAPNPIVKPDTGDKPPA